MDDLKYHEELLDTLEQHKPYDWQQASDALKLHEERIKSQTYLYLPEVHDFAFSERYYAKMCCCRLLVRSLQLQMDTRQEQTGWRTRKQQKANFKLLTKVLLLDELIKSLENIYSFYNTLND